jgi:release factor glutamine methyltransferase
MILKDYNMINTLPSDLTCRHFSNNEKKRWMMGIYSIYDAMRVACANNKYVFNANGITITAMKDVYAPGFFTDSLWFSQRIPEIVGTKSLLEIGTGTGIISIFCALNGASVIATDINPAAVQNAIDNVKRRGLSNVCVRMGDLYSPIKTGERFDYIFWAHPFNNWDSPVHDVLFRSGMDFKYQGVRGYIMGARKFLTRNGKLLLGTGDSADLETISRIAYVNDYTIRVLESEKVRLEEKGADLITYMICEFVPNRR